MRRGLIAAIVLSGGVQSALHAQAPAATASADKTLNLAAYVELLRSDVRTEKIAILTEVMGFTEAEDAAFWPIYRAYDAEMTRLGDERIALIKDYAASYAALTDDKAASLAQAAVALESRRSAAKAACYEKVKAALNPRIALRFLQVEHQLQLLIDLQVAALLPVAPAEKGK
jgi:hypothetical protein